MSPFYLPNQKDLSLPFQVSEEGYRVRVNQLKYNARGVVVIAVGNEHGETSSNPGRY